MKIVQSIMTKNPCYTEGRKITVKGLMLHSVGVGQPRASVFIKNWNKSSYDSACVHAFIDGTDGNVYQTLPWNHRGWHCGASGNNTHIGVEMCEPAEIRYTQGAAFVCDDVTAARKTAKRTYDTAVWLFAQLCVSYKLDPLAKGVIVSHSEGHSMGIASAHADPEHLWKGLGLTYTMDGFRKAVSAQMKKQTGEDSSAEADSLYRVQAGAFKSKKNAEAQLVKIKEAGFDAFLISDNGMYKIQAGAFASKANAEKMAKAMKAKKIEAFVVAK